MDYFTSRLVLTVILFSIGFCCIAIPTVFAKVDEHNKLHVTPLSIPLSVIGIMCLVLSGFGWGCITMNESAYKRGQIDAINGNIQYQKISIEKIEETWVKINEK